MIIKTGFSCVFVWDAEVVFLLVIGLRGHLHRVAVPRAGCLTGDGRAIMESSVLSMCVFHFQCVGSTVILV